MESPRKFNDCYFYYYSTCTKGDNCVFRHEPSALGCETMCTAWQQGKCIDKKCKLRHMELRKNRKQIQCYWENQPGGCRKKHCPFMHKNPDARTDGIAPSQPAPPMPHPQQVNNVPEGMPPANLVQEQPPMPTGVAPVPAPVPLLWQQQRQVLDSAILGVLPASSDLLPGRRVLPTHAHAHDAPNPYAPMPVDPLVVNFEEESDNESAPSSTPTKNDSPDHSNKISRSKSQELLLLERIQAESAAYYSYDGLPPAEPPKERKIVRTNLSTKYDRLSLDELAGKTQTTERRSSLDFKVLSLDEIRARKKINEPAVNVNNKPIVLNLNSRKRKLSSTQETITTSGNKMIKVVRSNSVVYKKVDQNATAVAQPTPVEPKPIEDTTSRKRTISEQNDMLYGDMQDDELVDNCFEFKRIKLLEPTTKPRLIRNTNKETNLKDTNLEVDDVQSDLINKLDDNDSDPEEVQIVSVELNDSLEDLVSDEVILVGAKNDPVVVDLSDDETDIITEIDLDKNVPDVVASCQKNSASDNSEIIFNGIIDSLLESDDDL